MSKLWVFKGGKTKSYEHSGDLIKIGRAHSSTICLADQRVSNRHARLVREANDWFIEDLGSTNGTFVNGQRVKRRRLTPGDRVRISQYEIMLDERFEVDDSLPGDESSDAIYATVPVIPPLLMPSSDAAPGSEEVGPMGSGVLVDSNDRSEETKLRLIQLIGEKLLRTVEMEQLAKEVVSLVTRQLRADRGFLCLLDQRGAPIPLASCGLRPGEQIRISRTVLGKMLEKKSGILIRQANTGKIDSLTAMNVSSTLYVPLWTADRIMGFLSLDLFATEQRVFTEKHLNLLIPIAHQAAVGIERCRLAKEAAEQQQVRSYLSKYLDEKIVKLITESAGEDNALIPAEREITILFSDIVSFTKIGEGLEPIVLSEFIHQYLTEMTQIIFEHGGTIDKYIGDAVMAIFGAPIADPESTHMAIRASLAMVQRIQRMQPPPGATTPLRVRFGLSTGKAVVGNIGSAQRAEYTAIGDLVNVASRLENFARPNEICIDEETFRRAGSAFEMRPISTVDVKNRHKPVQIYEVIREASSSVAAPHHRPAQQQPVPRPH